MISCDLENLNEPTKRILLNKEIIAINQDSLFKQAKRVIHKKDYDVLVKPLVNREYALGILNRTDKPKKMAINFKELGLNDKYTIRDVWAHTQQRTPNNSWKGVLMPHETVVLKLSK